MAMQQASDWIIKVGSAIAAIITLMQLYVVIVGFPPVMLHRTIFLVLIFILVFLTYPRDNIRMSWWNMLLVALSLAVGVYIVATFENINSRIAYVDDVTNLDIFFGLACVLVLLEATRRTCGNGLTIIVLAFFGYAFAGPWLPGLLGHPGISIQDLVDLQFLTPGGIFGVATGAVVSFVFFFLLFGACLEQSGASKVFLDTAMSLTAKRTGGVAKCAVVGSSLMGMTSGSAVANTVSTGAITIPMMKKGGYPSVTAGAIEAISSTGGQLMPPIMGVSAFIMAEIVGEPYLTIAIAANPAGHPVLLQHLFYGAPVRHQVRHQGRPQQGQGLLFHHEVRRLPIPAHRGPDLLHRLGQHPHVRRPQGLGNGAHPVHD